MAEDSRLTVSFHSQTDRDLDIKKVDIRKSQYMYIIFYLYVELSFWPMRHVLDQQLRAKS